MDAVCDQCEVRAVDTTYATLRLAGWYVNDHSGVSYCPACTAPTIGSLSQSIRELGEMLQVAERHPVYRARMTEVERLTRRVFERANSMMLLLAEEYIRSSGAEEVA